MREVIAILLLVGCYVVAVDAADPPPMRGLSFAAIITAFIVMFYLGLCIVERMNGMSNWFSIQPGKRTEHGRNGMGSHGRRTLCGNYLFQHWHRNPDAPSAPNNARSQKTKPMTPPATATPAIAADQAPRPESMEELSASSEDKLNKIAARHPKPKPSTPEEVFDDIFRAGK